MKPEQEREPTVSEALEEWREAERQAVRATAQREAADEAIAAAELAEKAARATAKASNAAQVAASEAARAAEATAEAAQKVLTATRTEGEAKRFLEQDAMDAEQEARAAHKSAWDRAERRHGLTQRPEERLPEDD